MTASLGPPSLQQLGMKKWGLGIFAQAEMMFEGTKEMPARQELTCSVLSSFLVFFHLLTPSGFKLDPEWASAGFQYQHCKRMGRCTGSHFCLSLMCGWRIMGKERDWLGIRKLTKTQKTSYKLGLGAEAKHKKSEGHLCNALGRGSWKLAWGKWRWAWNMG